MQKYGVKNPEKILEEEITKFLQGEKLTDSDLKKLDMKVKNLLKLKASKEALKNTLTKSMQEPSKSQVILPKIETKTDKEKLIKNNLFQYKTSSKTILADLYTPVGVYMRLRDLYPQSALI